MKSRGELWKDFKNSNFENFESAGGRGDLKSGSMPLIAILLSNGGGLTYTGMCCSTDGLLFHKKSLNLCVPFSTKKSQNMGSVCICDWGKIFGKMGLHFKENSWKWCHFCRNDPFRWVGVLREDLSAQFLIQTKSEYFPPPPPEQNRLSFLLYKMSPRTNYVCYLVQESFLA